MTKFFCVPTKICENVLLDILKGVCEGPWRNDTNSPKQWKHNITQIYIYSPWKQRPKKNNTLPLSKQNIHNKLFKQDFSYFSKKISVRQKALITFLVLYQWDLCCLIMKNRLKSGFFWRDKFISNFNVLNNIKITFYYSVYMRTSGKKVCISDEAERVQSVSYSHIVRSLSGLYTGVCLREGKRGTCLGPPFRAPSRYFRPHHNSVLCLQRGPQ